jgi:hypothetical protein
MVASASRGKRGQQFFSDLATALDAMLDKRLIVNELVDNSGVCALGALVVARKLDMTSVDPTEPDEVAALFGIATCLAQEVVYMNDERYDHVTPEERWKKMRDWVERNKR